MNAANIALSVAGLGVGVVSTGIAAMSFMRQARRAASRVRYDEGQYLVDVRYFGWLDIRDFVQPTNPDVVALYHKYGPDYWSLYDFVCRAISYRSDFGEYWYFPEETLASKQGDCEDSAILLCSLLQNPINSYVALGSYQGYGHAWVYLGQILETTFTRAQVTPDPGNYVPYLYFNDREVIELWPGALQDIYSVPRKEGTKLRLMAHG